MTTLGLLSLVVTLICLGSIVVGQRFMTGSFARADGFVLGWLFFWPMAGSLALGLLLLLIGEVVDSIRYTSWKKQAVESENAQIHPQ